MLSILEKEFVPFEPSVVAYISDILLLLLYCKGEEILSHAGSVNLCFFGHDEPVPFRS